MGKKKLLALLMATVLAMQPTISVTAETGQVTDSVGDYEGEETKEFEVVKTKRFTVKPMSVEEAILQMNLLGHTFFVFKNQETDEMNVVYKRKDGKYAVIESIE